MRRYAASPHKVFSAWLDPAKLGLFLPAYVGGRAARASIEARVQSEFLLTDDAGKLWARGTILALQPSHWLSLELNAEHDGFLPARIDISVSALKGGCELKLRHTVLPAQRQRVADWPRVLEVLAELVER